VSVICDDVLTRADQVAPQSLPEVMEHSVAMLLVHLGMNVETRVAKLGDLLGKQFNSLCRVAEYNRLIDLQLLDTSTCQLTTQWPQTAAICIVNNNMPMPLVKIELCDLQHQCHNI